MNTRQNPIPRLDLAPKLNRPLSLFNPLDYLRLLYWVFFFPQAIRWYVATFKQEKTLRIQGLLLNVLTPILICFILQEFNFSVDWWGVAFGVAWGVALGVKSAVAWGVAWGVAGVEWCWASAVAFGVAFGVTVGVEWGVASGLALRVAFSVGLGVGFGVAWGVASSLALEALGVASGLALGVKLGVALVALGVGLGVVWGVVLGVTIWRPEVWVMGSLLNLGSLQNSSWLFPRITPIPLPFLSSRLTSWLEQDWQLGLENANELLRYSLQFIPVVKGVNQVLGKTPPEHLIFKISQLAEHPYDWLLVKFASAALGEELKLQLIQGLFFWRKSKPQAQPRLDTPAHAAAAGFWYLHEKQPEKATEAFAVVSSLLYGQEMLTLAQILTIFKPAKTIGAIATLKLPDFPPKPYLRPQSWTAIKILYQVVEDVNLIKNSGSLSTGSLALNRALGKIKRILDQSETVPEAERYLIIDIAQNLAICLIRYYRINW